MIHLGIVGAESPMGKLVLQKIQEHKESYCLCFKVDSTAKKSLQDAVFTDVEDALLMLSPTLVLDFASPNTAYERAKVYQSYHIPAIMPMAGFDAEKIELLRVIRSSKTNFPTLVVESSFSLNQELMTEQTLQMLKVLAPDVQEIIVTLGYDQTDFDFSDCMPMVKSLNEALGISNYPPQSAPASFCNKWCKQKFGFVNVILMRTQFMNGMYDGEMKIMLQNSHIALHYASQTDDIWRGLEMLMQYVANHPETDTADLTTNMLSKLVRQCLL